MRKYSGISDLKQRRINSQKMADILKLFLIILND